VTINSAPPPLPDAPTIVLLGEYDVNGVNVGNVAAGGTTAYPRLQLEGYSVPGALIKVYDGVTLLGSAVAFTISTFSLIRAPSAFVTRSTLSTRLPC
jgi:hypothetical protein